MSILKKCVFGLLLIILGLVMLLMLPSPQKPAEKPWEVTVMPDGNSRVLGIHLGHTDYKTAQQHLGVFGKTALFVDPDGSRSVEAFFDSVNLAGLSAKLVMTLEVPDDRLEAMQARAGAGELKPSGAHQYELAEPDREYLLGAPVSSLTYIPTVRLKKDMIESRFGEPARIEHSDKDESGLTTESWFYPELGLRILYHPEQKPMLIYQARS